MVRTRWPGGDQPFACPSGFASAPSLDVRRARVLMRSRWTSRRSRQTTRAQSIPRLF
jgi:hypothetical protein